MLRVLAAVLFVPAFAFGQSVVLKSDSKVTQVRCGAINVVDLGLAVKSGPTALSTYIEIRNFRAGVINNPTPDLKFEINVPTEGRFTLYNGEMQWGVDRRVSEKSGCKIKMTRESKDAISFKLNCQDLVPTSRDSKIRASQQIINQLTTNELLRCVIEPEKS